MKFFKHTAIIGLSALALSGCGSDSNNATTAGGPVVVEKLYASVSTGEIQSFHLEDPDAGAAAGKVLRHVSPPVSSELSIGMKGVTAAKPAEMVFSDGMAFVRLSDSNSIQMFDVESDGLEHNHSIAVGVRPVHMYVDPDGKVWIMNDGARDGLTTPDSVSVIEKGADGLISHSARLFNGVDPFLTVGNGHHKAAFSAPSTSKPNTPKRVFVSNISDGTVSVIDNDATNVTTYLTVLATLPTGIAPHGIDFSPVSGKIYNSNTAGIETNKVSIIDAATLAIVNLGTGTGPGQIPASGSTHARHVHDNHDDPTNGRYVYILGAVRTPVDADPLNDTTTGYVSVIDASVADPLGPGGVIARTELPEVNPDHITFTPDGKKAYITSRAGNADLALKPHALKNNVIVVLDTDPASFTFNQVLAEIPVGQAADHRPKVEISGDGHLAFVSNEAETTVSVIDVATDTVVSTLNVGGAPAGLGIAKVSAAGGHAHP